MKFKKLYTSYYAKMRHIPPSIWQIRISLGQPNWWNPKRKMECVDLAPAPNMFRLKMPNAEKEG